MRWLRFSLIFLILCGYQPTQAGDILRIAMASNQDPERSGVYVWLKAFADEMRKAGYDTKIYPNSVLGREQDRTELVELGLIEVNDSGTLEVGVFSPLFQSISLPFLFDDYVHFDHFLHGTAFLNLVNRDTTPHGIRVIDVAFLGGMSGIFNSRRPIARLEDMRGLRLRAMDNTDLVIQNSWSVAGTQVSWEEVSQALQTGVAEGYINPPLVPIIFGHTRKLRYFTNILLMPSTRTIVVSEQWYNRQTSAQRADFDRAVIMARRANRRWAENIQAPELNMLRAAKVIVTEPTLAERRRFVIKTRAVYDQIIPPESVKTALDLADQTRRLP
jgi:TRAP-type C4-dicarboxylate transport system substrate-binding protein